MESSILSEVDDTSILRTGLPTPLWPSSQLATGLSPVAPRSGLERSDFVHWHRRDDRSSWRTGRLAGVKLTLSNNRRISAVDPFRTFDCRRQLARRACAIKSAYRFLEPLRPTP